MPSFLVTGATGFIGGHVAEAAAARGHAVTALVRPGKDTAALEAAGITIHRGDMTDPESLRTAVEGADVVVHCAAKVGDWGPVEGFRKVNVDGLRSLLEACKGKPLRRFIHMSSLGVYAARHHYGTDETEPLPDTHVDGYTQTKVEAEKLAMQYHRAHKVPVVILRPGFVYGPRDQTVLPRLINRLRTRFNYIGSKNRALNTIYIANLLDAVFLAVDAEKAVGQVYNLTDGEFVSKRKFIESLINGLGLPKAKPVVVPVWIARIIVWVSERRVPIDGPRPVHTQAGLKFLGLNLDFSIEKAKRELGYKPRYTFDEGMKETLAWYKGERKPEPAEVS